MNKTPVGIIGTGLMGTACARRLLAAGHSVAGYDVDAAKASAFAALGGHNSPSIATLARDCHTVVLAVFNTDQVEAACDALLAARPAGLPPLTAICVSTCDPDRIAALAQRLPVDRLHFVEMPVSGTSDQTARGEALGLVGGDPAAADAVKDVLDAICPRRHHLGAAGNGGRAKLAINLILGINRAALAEGLVFAERMGLPLDAFLGVARDSAAYSQIMDIKGKKMIDGDFTPHGKIAQTLKDFSLMLELAQRLQQQLPLATTYTGIVEGCMAQGEAEFDNAAVINEIRRRSRAS
ncbi:MAG: NAD(P)-dependent oxidoreductase [Burkholderiales bacterium]|jgi:3-hydroxyisobutyrate dehydrogenase-like beta-hydroxyacid dehydrogenase|nr:NAD(P)-dependent oxidoreductase [Burkholderiales bacterium]